MSCPSGHLLVHAIGSAVDKRTGAPEASATQQKWPGEFRLVGSGRVRSDLARHIHVGRPPGPLHGLPAASTLSVCPACCRWGWPGEGGSLLPPPEHCVGEDQSPQNGDRRAKAVKKKNIKTMHTCYLGVRFLLWRTGQLLATCTPFPSLPFPKSTVAQAPPPATPSVFDCFAPIVRLPHLPPLPASHNLALAFPETLWTETLSRMAGHGLVIAAIVNPLRTDLRSQPTTRSRRCSALAPMFLRGSTVQDNVFDSEAWPAGQPEHASLNISSPLSPACASCCGCRAAIEAPWSRE